MDAFTELVQLSITCLWLYVQENCEWFTLVCYWSWKLYILLWSIDHTDLNVPRKCHLLIMICIFLYWFLSCFRSDISLQIYSDLENGFTTFICPIWFDIMIARNIVWKYMVSHNMPSSFDSTQYYQVWTYY